MKLLTIISLLISTISLSQTYTYFDTYNKNEVFVTETMKWRQDSTVWHLFLERDLGIMLFQDTITKDWFSFRVVEEGSKDQKAYNYSYRCVDNTNKEAYLYFYKDQEYSIIKIQYPYLTLRFKKLLNK